MSHPTLRLSDAIQSLRSELIAAQEAGGGNRLPLKVLKAEIELVLEIAESETGTNGVEGGIPHFFRVSIGGSVATTGKTLHRIRLELTLPGDPNLSGTHDFIIDK